MPSIDVLKFGSSVLRTTGDLHEAVDEIYRRWRCGSGILAVVSAFEGVTDRLIAEATALFGENSPEALATYVATGEQKTAALLVGALCENGIPARYVDPREIALMTDGPRLESAPVGVDIDALHALWNRFAVLVLPGFYGIAEDGGVSLFGRGGSDMSAIFLAAKLQAPCRLVKDVLGVFDSDPAANPGVRRYEALSWARAIDVSGPLIQAKALEFAQSHATAFEVGRANEEGGTTVGSPVDRRSASQEAGAPPLRVALLGCGVVGRGVYEAIHRYPKRFEVAHVIVREVHKHHDVKRVSTDLNAALDPEVDIVIACIPGIPDCYAIIHAALLAGKFVITSNKAVIAAHFDTLGCYTKGTTHRLWYSAAVGGALPALETVAALGTPVREIRAIINGTCGVVLDAWAQGTTRAEAIALAQRKGFAEADPHRDLSGLDSADKLALLMEVAFGEWRHPREIPTQGIDTLSGDPTGYKLIARATRTADGVVASIAPELPATDSFLAQALGAENRVEIELTSGEIVRLRGQGAGRWPTATSVMGDLHEVGRTIYASRLGGHSQGL
jgi:homoserine dehydrogenase